MSADPQLEAFCAFFKNLDKSCTKSLYKFYTPDIVFQDALHRIEGTESLERYFSSLYSNVTACHFVFHERQRNGQEAFTTWTLHLEHPRLNKGRVVEVEGCSHLRFADDGSGRVVRHRDYFDAGALLYERLPLLGGAIRLIKRQLDA